MANESIRAAFERMWQHTVAKIENEVAGLDGDTKVLVVTVEWDEENECDKASHTPKQIYDHVQNGGIAVLKHNTTQYSLFNVDEEWASFWLVADDLLYTLLEFDESCECTLSDQSLMSSSAIRDEYGRIITVDENYIPSMTSQEIYNHVHNGGRVALKYKGQIYSLASCIESSAYFNYYDDGYTMHCIEIYGNEFYKYGNCNPASIDWVNGKLGPIDEALDNILDIQQSLIDSALQQAEGVEF